MTHGNRQEKLRSDALERLEWYKVTEYLSRYAVLPYTQEQLRLQTPWISAQERMFYTQATEEMLSLFNSGKSLTLGLFDIALFEKPLRQHDILPALGLLQIGLLLNNTRQVLLFFKESPHTHSRLNELAQGLEAKPELLQTLKKSIGDQGEILSTASPELADARRKLERAQKNVQEKLEQLLSQSHIKETLQDPIWMQRDGRYVLPVRTDRKGSVAGISRGVSQTGATIFIEPLSLAAEQNSYAEAQMDVEIEEHRILRNLSDACFLVCDSLFQSIETLSRFDALVARAKFANALNGKICAITNKLEGHDRFSFRNAKHPLFLYEKKTCVENDLELQNPSIWILSGPNAGGKTVTMKTVGIFILMAKAGLALSCDDPHMFDYENVFVELGDRQNREENLSTFSGHLTQIKNMLECASEKTLILLDEGFVGTDPVIGVALARAVLEYFAQKNTTVIITTHFSSLKTLSSQDARFLNGSMEFEAKQLAPTYKLLNGIPGQSYAIELAERMGIPLQIIQKSREYYGDDSQRMESILRDLQNKRSELEAQLHTQQELNTSLEHTLEQQEHEHEKVRDLRENLVESYKDKLQKKLNSFTNRLEILERQFEKEKKHLLLELREESERAAEKSIAIEKENKASAPAPTESKPSEKPTTPHKKESLSGLEALAKINLESAKPTATKPRDFKPPRQTTSRSLLDEARLSLDETNEDFDFFALTLQDETEGIFVKKETKPKKPPVVKETLTLAKVTQKKPAPQAYDWKKGLNQFKKQNTHYGKQKNKMDSQIEQTLPLSSNTVDLRGKTVDAALDDLDIQMDRLWQRGERKIIVIHGHGMGKVKEGVRRFLENTRMHLAFRPGRQGEGGDGVTVVEFRR